MLIEVNIDNCIEFGVTASQYCFLQLLWEKKNNTALEYLKMDTKLVDTMSTLVDKGFLLYYKDGSCLIDRKKCCKLFGLEDEHFWEFFITFPIKVGTGLKSRLLRASDPKSKNALDAMAKYKALIKTRSKHNHVMACLKAEVEHKKLTNSLIYMHNILTWLHQNHWQMSEHLLNTEKPKTEAGHGERLI